MKAPKSTKILVACLVLVIAGLGVMALSGCSYGPSPAFIDKMEARAEKHFPRYEYLIESASIPQLEKILGKSEGAYKNAKVGDIANLKKALVLEVKAWRILIQKNKELLAKQQKK